MHNPEEASKRWEEQRKKERKFEGKTDRVPDGLPQRMKEAIIKYCETVKEDIFKGLNKKGGNRKIDLTTYIFTLNQIK